MVGCTTTYSIYSLATGPLTCEPRAAYCADAASDAEVQGLFDDIEYQKGGAVLRMLWNYMSSSDYANSRLPPDVQPGHDDDVSPHWSLLGNAFMRS